MLKEQRAQCRGLGLGLGLDWAVSPAVFGRGGRRRGSRDPKEGAKNCGRFKREDEGRSEGANREVNERVRLKHQYDGKQRRKI